MDITTLKARIKESERLKKTIHSILVNKADARPRWFTRVVINRFFHQYKSKSKVRSSARMDIYPFYQFELGQNSTIEDYCTVTNGVGDVIIGNGVRIGIGSVLMGPVEIQDNTILGQHILVTGLDHIYQDVTVPIKDQGVSRKKTLIGKDCFIGANASILPGVTIGNHCVVAAGAVVTKDIPDYHIAVGNPAKLVKRFDFDSQEWVRIHPSK